MLEFKDKNVWVEFQNKRSFAGDGRDFFVYVGHGSHEMLLFYLKAYLCLVYSGDSLICR